MATGYRHFVFKDKPLLILADHLPSQGDLTAINAGQAFVEALIGWFIQSSHYLKYDYYMLNARYSAGSTSCPNAYL
jgi:hypothetical protein